MPSAGGEKTQAMLRGVVAVGRQPSGVATGRLAPASLPDGSRRRRYRTARAGVAEASSTDCGIVLGENRFGNGFLGNRTVGLGTIHLQIVSGTARAVR